MEMEKKYFFYGKEFRQVKDTERLYVSSDGEFKLFTIYNQWRSPKLFASMDNRGRLVALKVRYCPIGTAAIVFTAARAVYEAWRGDIPHTSCIGYEDGNREHINIENLYLIENYRCKSLRKARKVTPARIFDKETLIRENEKKIHELELYTDYLKNGQVEEINAYIKSETLAQSKDYAMRVFNVASGTADLLAMEACGYLLEAIVKHSAISGFLLITRHYIRERLGKTAVFRERRSMRNQEPYNDNIEY